MRIRRNLESLSFRLRSRCLRTATAFRHSVSAYEGSRSWHDLPSWSIDRGPLGFRERDLSFENHSISQRPSRGIVAKYCMCSRTSSFFCKDSGEVLHTIWLEDAEDLIAYSYVSKSGESVEYKWGSLTSDDLDLSNTMGVPQSNTDLWRSRAFLCELADLIDDLFGGNLEPRWGCARVWDSTGWYTFAIAMETTHDCWWLSIWGSCEGCWCSSCQLWCERLSLTMT